MGAHKYMICANGVSLPGREAIVSFQLNFVTKITLKKHIKHDETEYKIVASYYMKT